MHIHILGICGTFMGSLAVLAKQLGYRVSGSDANVYPPMSTQLQEQGIDLMEGFRHEHLQPSPDLVVIGNALSRGNPAVEYTLSEGLNYMSGPQWLAQFVLHDKWVLGVAGTHGKTTTDIFDDLEAIETQFHHLVRTLPGNGLIISPHDDSAIEVVLRMGCWTRRQQLGVAVPDEVCKKLAANGGAFWNAYLKNEHGSEFELIKYGQKSTGEVMNRALIQWEMAGLHNVKNALAAVAAAHHVGVEVTTAAEALKTFKGVKRRMELRGSIEGIKVYDDFAHHPTAIKTTLNGMAEKLKSESGKKRLIAVIEPRSATMKSGAHQNTLNRACESADMVVWYKTEDCKIDFQSMLSQSKVPSYAFSSVAEIVTYLKENSLSGDYIIIMSNGGFEGIHDKLIQELIHGSTILN